MSTKSTIAGADTTMAIGGETFHESLHFYEECFDADRDVFLDLFQQGVFANVSQTFVLPRAEAIRLFVKLGGWAAEAEKE